MPSGSNGAMLFLRRIKYFIVMLGKVVKRGSYWGRMYCVDDDKKLMYIAICKCASTSFRSIFCDIPWTSDKEFRTRARSAENYRANIDLGKYKDYYKFSFVRNPFSRLASCYEERVRLCSNKSYFRFYLMGYFAEDKGFPEFVRRVTRVPYRLTDRHFCRQSTFLFDKDGKPLYDYLGHIESLQKDYEPIRERFGLPEIPKLRQSKASRTDWRDYYDENSAKMAYEYYREDIEKFGYEGEYEKLLAHIKQRRTNE